jgi:AraC-like DNA-binding protein
VIFNKNYPILSRDYHGPLPVWLTYAGHERIESEDYRWNNQRMRVPPDFFFIQCTLSGKGVFRTQEGEWKIESQAAFLCTQDYSFEYFFDRKLADHWEFFWLGLRGPTGLQIFRNLQEEFGKVIRLNPQSASVGLFWEIWEKSRDKAWRGPAQISTLAYGFLLQLQDDLRHKGAQDLQERLDRALRYLDGHFAEPLDVSVISPRFGYTREHFTRLFRKKTGMSPGRYIQDLRLGKARELLRTTDLPLKSVAEVSGLQSANYLCRQFKLKLGMTPREYKESLDAAVAGKA